MKKMTQINVVRRNRIVIIDNHDDIENYYKHMGNQTEGVKLNTPIGFITKVTLEDLTGNDIIVIGKDGEGVILEKNMVKELGYLKKIDLDEEQLEQLSKMDVEEDLVKRLERIGFKVLNNEEIVDVEYGLGLHYHEKFIEVMGIE